MPNTQDNSAVQQALIEHVGNAVSASRRTTVVQLVFAAILMLAGAAVGVISVELKQTAVAAGFGTALLGAGATLLPAGASASASSQLHNALSQLTILAATPAGPSSPGPTTATTTTAPPPATTSNGAAPEAAVRSAVEADAADAAALAAELRG